MSLRRAQHSCGDRMTEGARLTLTDDTIKMKNMSTPAVLDAVGCMLRCVCSEGRGTDSSLDSNS